ncbi:hypothetical protein KR044_001956 [Drosophila immigrans]|nr:hypothetical protein KR044_001956 [Drosophila immigrans]
MYYHKETELNTNDSNNIHIINRTSGKNCSTSSTDSGVGLVDNAAIYRVSPTANTKSRKSDETKENAKKEEEEEEQQTKPDAEAKQSRISIEVEAKVNLSKARKTSPALSIRSTTISIVSIDEDAIDSSCIDSDSEAEPEDGCTVHKLGQQVKFPPHSEELTQLNKGLTVISRQVQPSNGQAPAVAGDIVAQQLLNGNLNLATPSTPASPQQQIGSIALSNTTDVTFGDKHYYEGPVTIQQILIDSRDKWKSAEGQDNPAFNAQATPNATGSKLDESCAAPTLCPFLPHSISRKAIIITAVFVALTIILGVTMAIVFGKSPLKSKLGDGEDTRQSIPINSPLGTVVVPLNTLSKIIAAQILVISVDGWGGRQPAKKLTSLKLPVHRVIISHTAAEGCESEVSRSLHSLCLSLLSTFCSFAKDVCAARVRVVQGFHMDGWSWDHIGYNFLIGGDGLVYEGRGWDSQGAHTLGYNIDSIGISFIGTFIKIWPTERQLLACKLLIEEGVRLKKLVPDYKLYGHRQLSATESPGEILYGIIQKWPHWTNKTL